MTEKILTRVIVRLDGSIVNAVFTDRQLEAFKEYLQSTVEAAEGFPFPNVCLLALQDGEFLARAAADLGLDDYTEQAIVEELYDYFEKLTA